MHEDQGFIGKRGVEEGEAPAAGTKANAQIVESPEGMDGFLECDLLDDGRGGGIVGDAAQLLRSSEVEVENDERKCLVRTA